MEDFIKKDLRERALLLLESKKEEQKNATLTIADAVKIVESSPYFVAVNEKTKGPLVYDYEKGIYSNDKKLLQQALDEVLLGWNNVSQKKDVDFQYRINRKISYQPVASETRGAISFKNGVLIGKELVNHSPRNVVTFYKNFEFDLDAKEPVFKNEEGQEWKPSDLFNSLSGGDKKKEDVLWEAVNVALHRSETNMFLFLWEREGGSGKSTFGKMIESLVGEDRTVNETLNNFGGRFALSDLNDASFLFGDEVPSDELVPSEAVSVMKTLATSGRFKIEKKGKDKEYITFDGLILQASNGMINSKDKTGGLKRRLTLIKPPHLPKEQRIKEVQSWVTSPETLSWVIAEAVRRYPDGVKKITELDDEIDLTDERYVAFVESKRVQEMMEKCERIPHKMLYNAFVAYTSDEPSLRKVGSVQLKRTIADLMKKQNWVCKTARVKPEHIQLKTLNQKGEPFDYYKEYGNDGNTIKAVWVKEEQE